jgi:uncharacterized protein YraI
VQASAKAIDADPIAPTAHPKGEQRRPAPADASQSLALSPASETGSTVDQAGARAANHVARTVSDVNMRAGPSNGQAVLATIPRGSAVEVIDCRQWCQVVFGGQRGWIYKGFVGASPPRGP